MQSVKVIHEGGPTTYKPEGEVDVGFVISHLGDLLIQMQRHDNRGHWITVAAHAAADWTHVHLNLPTDVSVDQPGGV